MQSALNQKSKNKTQYITLPLKPYFKTDRWEICSFLKRWHFSKKGAVTFFTKRDFQFATWHNFFSFKISYSEYIKILMGIILKLIIISTSKQLRLFLLSLFINWLKFRLRSFAIDWYAKTVWLFMWTFLFPLCQRPFFLIFVFPISNEFV